MMTGPAWISALFHWFDHSKRDFPWREDSPRDPYKVWISETMLQQTRTETVRPYYLSWMEQYPHVSDLAEAEESDVLHAWQGLGYYSRARHIHQAAQRIMEDYGGEIPHDRKSLQKLPGIGEYTAGAILSIAYGEKQAAVDGNLLRVYARLYAIEDDILQPAGRKKVCRQAEEDIPEDRPGDFNEALMDLGAAVCIPHHPRCALCPVRSFCRAWEKGLTEVLPVRSKKKKPSVMYAACGIIRREGLFLMHLRPDQGMLASMWEFPMALTEKKGDSIPALETLAGGLAGPVLWKHRHVFTHRIWNMTAYTMSMEGPGPDGPDWRWQSAENWKKLPLAGPHARLAAFIESAFF